MSCNHDYSNKWLLKTGASVYTNGKIYFSNSRWNGLFSLDVDTFNVNYIRHFPNDSIDVSLLHKDVIINGDRLYFIPWRFSDYLSVYNFADDSFCTLKIPRRYFDSVNSYFEWKGSLYLIAGYCEFPRWKINYQTLELTEIKNPLCDKDGYRSCHIVRGDKVWYSYHNTNVLVSWNIETDEYEVIQTPAENIYNIYDIGSSIVIAEFGSYRLWSFDGKNFAQIYDGHLNENILRGNEYAYGAIKPFAGGIVVSPAFGNEIMYIKEGSCHILVRDEKKKYCEPYQSYMDMKIINNNLWIMPYEADELYIYDTNMNLLKKNEILLTDQDDRIRCLKDMKGYEIILSEKNGFHINDLFDFIQM